MKYKLITIFAKSQMLINITRSAKFTGQTDEFVNILIYLPQFVALLKSTYLLKEMKADLLDIISDIN